MSLVEPSCQYCTPTTGGHAPDCRARYDPPPVSPPACPYCAHQGTTDPFDCTHADPYTRIALWEGRAERAEARVAKLETEVKQLHASDDDAPPINAMHDDERTVVSYDWFVWAKARSRLTEMAQARVAELERAHGAAQNEIAGLHRHIAGLVRAPR